MGEGRVRAEEPFARSVDRWGVRWDVEGVWGEG